ncbi:MAG: hypothetical protein JWM99_4896 [Verrucomicrobiales bacterium]|nr:hypothetical protein [Verrucomicrobiales bacterium]
MSRRNAFTGAAHKSGVATSIYGACCASQRRGPEPVADRVCGTQQLYKEWRVKFIRPFCHSNVLRVDARRTYPRSAGRARLVIRLRRFYYQVKVISHQAISMRLLPGLLTRFSQRF